MSTDSDTSSLPIDPSRRQVLGLSAAAAAGLVMPALGSAAPAQTEAASGKKVLRYAFQIAETGFDPPKLSDIYSRIVTQHIYEGLFTYDHLARPAKIKPLTAAAMPEISADFRVYTVKIKPGIFFASDEAFGGKPRELVAQDYVYAFKRFADPANKASAWGDLEEAGFVGLTALREEALAKRTPFDYEREVQGLRALDRYTLRFEVTAARPRLLELLAGGDLYGAIAREVVEHYGEQIAAHPVGTGPFKLVQWRRSSLIVLERNPEYREMFYAAEPAADDAEGQALLARFKGRRLPMIDRVEVSIIEEEQPRWLSFLNGQNDFVERVPEQYITTAMPGGQVAPNLKRHGIQGYRVLVSDVVFTFYNMEHPVIGGYTPDKVALRRAINLGVDLQREIDLVRRGQGIKAQAMEVPNTTGYDPHFKSEMSDYDPARARALLDMFGYVDKNGDGWREMPDGSPLVLVKHTQPDQRSRQLDELWQRNMNALGLKIEFSANKWPENLRAAQAGSVMIWGLASSAAQPDGQGALARLYGPLKGSANLARFENKAFDEIYLKMQGIPDGPERNALFREAKRIAIAYAPYKCHLHRYVTDMAHPWIIGYRRPDFWQDWWQYVDVDESKRKA